MRKKLFIALMLILMLVPLSVASAKDKPLRFETSYSFALGTKDDDAQGRNLVWSGNVSGTFEGTMEWWMHFVGEVGEWNRLTGITNHWEDAVWIIYPDDGDDESYIMGGEWGSTTMLPETAQKGAVWRAKGTVLDASENYMYLVGRKIHDGGEVDWGPPPWGTGKFHIK
jgi:hypothetical protein